MALKGHCSLTWFLVKCSQNLTQFLEVSNRFRTFSDSSRKSHTVFGSFKQLSEFLNSSQKSQTVLRSLKRFSEVSISSRKFQTALGRFKQFSEALDDSRKSQKVLGGLKQFQAVSNCPRSLKQFLDFANTFYHLVLFLVAFVDCCQISLQSRFLLIKTQCVTQNSRNARMAQDDVTGEKLITTTRIKLSLKISSVGE